jgi:hypothetical protein
MEVAVMYKLMILPYPPNPNDKPYVHLEPVVTALIEDGNEAIRVPPFYLDRDGWRCDLKKPINFKLLKDRFEFPKSIVLSEQLDKIFCLNSWTEIKGSKEL